MWQYRPNLDFKIGNSFFSLHLADFLSDALQR